MDALIGILFFVAILGIIAYKNKEKLKSLIANTKEKL